MLTPTHKRRVILLGAAALLSACGDAGSNTPKNRLPEPVAIPDAPPRAVSTASTTGCALDEDCVAGSFCFQGRCGAECGDASMCAAGESCSDRGRCQTGAALRPGDQDRTVLLAATPTRDDADTSTSIGATSEPNILVKPGQSAASLTLSFTRPTPPAGLAYRIDRTDSEITPAQILRIPGGVSEFTLQLPPGKADPALGAESERVSITIVTAAGSAQARLIPTPSISGSYLGQLQIDTFGSAGLPIDLQIVTQPADATFEDAEQIWLLLPVGHDKLLSPIAPDAQTPFVARELTYDTFVKRWVGVFDAAFVLGPDHIIQSAKPDQVRRALRFELEAGERDTLIGSFSDRWSGLYEARSGQGVRTLEDVTIEGELNLIRVADTTVAQVSRTAVTPAAPALLPAPPIDACAASDMFAIAPIDVDGAQRSCDAIPDAAAFVAAAPGDQASCALAIAQHALAAPTTTAQITAFLDDAIPDPDGKSFTDFMQDCAAGTDGACVPAPAILCARQLTASAYRAQDGMTPDLARLANAYQHLSNEAFLGRQLGAFQTDTTLRLKWLQSSDYPAIVTSAVRDLNTMLLDQWRTSVLEVQLGVLGGQFDASGLAVLSQGTTTQDARAARQDVLMEMAQTWRASMDALVLATSRWNTLLQSEPERAQRTAYISAKLLDLYLAAGILKNLNIAAEAGFLNARLASGFGNLLRELTQLALPFDKLIYARDAEVVVSTSLDPTSNNLTLLAERERDAEAEIARAGTSVQSVIQTAQVEALRETVLRDRINNNISDLHRELIELCGLPVNCAAADVGVKPECQANTEAGKCGLALKADGSFADPSAGSSDVANTSEAGRAVLSIIAAEQEVDLSRAELAALKDRIALDTANTDAFAEGVIQYRELRAMNFNALEAKIEGVRALVSANTAQIFDTMSALLANQRANADTAKSNIRDWQKLRVRDRDMRIGLLTSAGVLTGFADIVNTQVDFVDDLSDALINGLPTSVGLSTDPSFPARLSIGLAKFSTKSALRQTALGARTAASVLNIARESQALTNEIKLANLQDDATIRTIDFEQKQEALRDSIERNDRLTASEVQQIEDAYALIAQSISDIMENGNDETELGDRQTRLYKLITEQAGMELRVVQNLFAVDQRSADYAGIVQRAQLLQAKLDELNRQRANVNALVGSPAVLFGRANKLSQAEARLERAKDKLMDYLVALEYFAVRPFMDQRIQILLARNTYQLEAIFEELKRLESRCGGAVNTATTERSLRDDFLHIAALSEDPVTAKLQTAAQRLRALLQRGFVPIDKRVRYTSDASIGALLATNPDILSATFYVGLSDFSNLAATCNAKLAALDVQLVGEGLGAATPTVTILYDGTSYLRSCQPGIEDYVAMFGPDTTNFGALTYLRTPGRSISPIAGINTFPEGSTNLTLNGLPIASQYTVLINTKQGENSKIDWSKLEDIKIKFSYSYQDVFPVGQCQ